MTPNFFLPQKTAFPRKIITKIIITKRYQVSPPQAQPQQSQETLKTVFIAKNNSIARRSRLQEKKNLDNSSSVSNILMDSSTFPGCLLFPESGSTAFRNYSRNVGGFSGEVRHLQSRWCIGSDTFHIPTEFFRKGKGCMGMEKQLFVHFNLFNWLILKGIGNEFLFGFFREIVFFSFFCFVFIFYRNRMGLLMILISSC